ncbi:MAG TPA: prepilin-type N-terminal cleavage/methylation domain-containing protein [Acidobacteriaceae bacterium]|jgi:general secretion pathway protein G|nr:prepilin-type N-terminal cleavage/methylation domain-containing protein [Acidobacteriaceae bacterium]
MVRIRQFGSRSSLPRFEVQGSRFKTTHAGCLCGLEARSSNLEPESGFTLLELMIVMAIIATLAAMAIPSFTRNVVAAKEAVLREDLQVMRTAIGSYTVDKQKAPQSLEDLVTGGYLKAVPKDPITGRTDTWITSQSDTLGSVDQTDSGGIDDVHSGAQLSATDGTSYNTW